MSAKPAIDTKLLEERAEDLFEHAPCGYVSTVEDGTIVKINQTLLDWLGYERSEMLQGKRFQELLNMGGRIFFETHFAPLLRMQGFANEINFDLVTKERRQIPVLTSTIQRRDDSGNAIVNRITVFNITDRKKYERELLIERQRAEKAAKAKAEFLSMMSHEIRTPMNAVIGIAALLERTPLTGEQREYTSMLKSSSENLMNLLNSILDFSKIEAGRMMLEDRDFELRHVLHECTRGLESRAQEKGLPIRVSVDPRVPAFVVGDPVKLGQVLTNLVGNAIKFTEKGFVEISVTSLGNSGESVRLGFTVADTGIGISADRLPHIFDEFTQANSEIGMRYGGSGLGLAISHKLIELFGGKIAVTSQPGQGSRFNFELSFKTSAQTLSTAKILPGFEEGGLLRGLRVLVAEDNEDNVFIAERLLSSWGIIVSVASNGRQAVEQAIQTPLDLILMDLRMPQMNGYEATAQIRAMSDERLRRLPVIAFSASTKVGEEDLVEITDFNDVIGKPFRPEDLFAKIARATGRAVDVVSGSAVVAVPPVAGTVGSASSAEVPGFTLDAYREALDDDTVALAEILQLVIQSYRNARVELAEALLNADAAKFEFQSHRIKNSVEMLKAEKLKQALAQARATLAAGAGAAAVQPLQRAFTDMMDQLQPFAQNNGTPDGNQKS